MDFRYNGQRTYKKVSTKINIQSLLYILKGEWKSLLSYDVYEKKDMKGKKVTLLYRTSNKTSCSSQRLRKKMSTHYKVKYLDVTK